MGEDLLQGISHPGFLAVCRWIICYDRFRLHLTILLGLTLGRVVLLGVNKKVNIVSFPARVPKDFNPSWEKYAPYTYTLLSHFCKFTAFLHPLDVLCRVRRHRFQLVVWLVPSFAIGTVAVCCIGVLLGPMYPIAINHTSRIIPRSLVTGSIGWISACGAAGSSLLPFLTGALASKFGIVSLQPLYVFCQVCLPVRTLTPM